MGNNFDEYERDYLKRLGHSEEELEEIDYVVLSLVRNGISKYKTLLDRLPGTSSFKILHSFNKLSKKGYLKNEEDDDGLIEKIFNIIIKKVRLSKNCKFFLPYEKIWGLLAWKMLDG